MESKNYNKLVNMKKKKQTRRYRKKKAREGREAGRGSIWVGEGETDTNYWMEDRL